MYWRDRTRKNGSPYSITERRVPELIPILGNQPTGDVSHKPGGRLSLLSARPAVTPATHKRAATNFAAWWTEAQWAWTVCLRLFTRQRRGCDLNPGRPSAPESSTLMGLLQLRFEHDSSTIPARFEHDTSTTRYNTLRGLLCARIRDRFEHSTRISGRRVLHVDWQLNAHSFILI